jgi:hypothetical protein
MQRILAIIFLFVPGSSHFSQFRCTLAAAIVFFYASFTNCGAQVSDLEISVPRAKAAVIDGVLSPAEWDKAYDIKVSEASHIRLMHDGKYLYIGLSDKRSVIGSIQVDRGDKIEVLHSSASLGKAVYETKGNYWKLIRNFTWLCKKDDDAVRFKAAQEKHLLEESWLASNMSSGNPGEMEYQIAIPEGLLRMAITYITIPEGKTIQWPSALEEETRYVPLLTGNPPGLAAFSPEHWLTVRAYQ